MPESKAYYVDSHLIIAVHTSTTSWLTLPPDNLLPSIPWCQKNKLPHPRASIGTLLVTTAQDKETSTSTESREIRTKQENLLVDHFSLETWGLIPSI